MAKKEVYAGSTLTLDLPAYFAKLVADAIGRETRAGELIVNAQRWSDSDVNIPYKSFTAEQLETIYQLARTHERGIAAQISALKKASTDPIGTKCGNLKVLAQAIVKFIAKKPIDGWLYRRDRDGRLLPYLVTNVHYQPSDPGKEIEARVTVNLKAQTPGVDGKGSFTMITMNGGDLSKGTVDRILLERGYHHEDAELKQEYEAALEIYAKYRIMLHEQFWVPGDAIHHDRYWRSNDDKVRPPALVKAVNEEDLVSRTVVAEYSPDFWIGEVEELEDLDTVDEPSALENALPETKRLPFTQIPVHPYLFFFDLNRHRNVWVYATDAKPYEYDTSLKDKLILPDLHRDLIDILANDLDTVLSDVIEGKSGGTTILCKGGPGLGKTLTAEVYSEVVKRPLYRVHSGQLGVAPDTVQKKLEEVLQRAARWKAVMLIDEADVYIRRRGDDLDHNAVVASFLRTLEYFDGLLFMTTNRSDDVDDAIQSRCIATILYEEPAKEIAAKIWKVLSTQFGHPLPDATIERLTEIFPKIAGRDIKELLKLTIKYAGKKQVPITLELFGQLAAFRGLRPASYT